MELTKLKLENKTIMVDFPVHSNDDSSKTESSHSSKGPKGKMPDFIFLDDTQDYLKGTYTKKNYQQEKEVHQPLIKSSLSLRLLCLLGMLLCFVIAFGMLLWIGIVFVLAALLFFQNQTLNEYLRRFWNFYLNTSVMALGLLVACFSPVIGFGLLLIYFSFQSQSGGNTLWQTILNNTFTKN